MEKLLWDLFKKTGKIEYYLKYKDSIRNNETNKKL